MRRMEADAPYTVDRVDRVETVEIPRVFVNANDSQAELAVRAIAALRDTGGMCWVGSRHHAGMLRGAAKMVLEYVPDASLVSSSEGDDQAVFTFTAAGNIAVGAPPHWWA